MPELTVNPLALIVFPLLVGAIIGWLARGSRVKREKYALSVSWQEQMSAQKTEHNRIAEQNRKLMSQVSEYRNAREAVDQRVAQLAGSLEKAKRDGEAAQQALVEADAQLDEMRSQRDALRQSLEQSATVEASRDDALREKDEKIFKLSRELDSWQNRLPPLLDNFRARDLEAQQLDVELKQAREQIGELRRQISELAQSDSRLLDETTVESIDEMALAADLDASNEQYGNDLSAPEDAERAPEPQFEDLALAVNGRAHDDLQQIKGVGPAIEKTLNELGIYRFDQIASMDDIEIDRVAQELRGFQSRIHREDWIGQARLLQVEQTSSTAH